MSFPQSTWDGLYNPSKNPRESWRALHRNLKSVSPRPILKLSKNTHACVCHSTRDGIYNQPMNPCALTRIRASYTSAMYNCVTRAEVLRSLLRKHENAFGKAPRSIPGPPKWCLKHLRKQRRACTRPQIPKRPFFSAASSEEQCHKGLKSIHRSAQILSKTKISLCVVADTNFC